MLAFHGRGEVLGRDPARQDFMPDEEGGRARHLERLRERPNFLEVTKNFGIAHVSPQPLDIEPPFGGRGVERRRVQGRVIKAVLRP